jgi:DNA-binding MurR/RpiR family transcriptional regulator
MASYSIAELADAYNVSRITMWRYIKKLSLRSKNKFNRTSVSKLYNERDAARIAKLIGFTLPKK